jgi:hypothetical protein
MLGEIPSVGDRLSLRVDPANPQHFDYDQASSATTTVTSHSSAMTTSTTHTPAHAASAAAFESEISAITSESSRQNLADELSRLADLHQRGALTDSEFAAAKKKLLR